ncbi:MAG: glycosyltransferase family 4 protein [Thaumarchaeota archaeon]|nr:glycosyltransferase family 4 protein [Nitrososphaerota archaeon]
MKIGILGNMANNGYNNAKALRQAGVEADLIIPSSTMELYSSVEWEEGIFGPEIDATKFNFKMAVDAGKLWERPGWVKYYDNNDWRRRDVRTLTRFFRTLEFYEFVRQYDILELHVPFAYTAPYLNTPNMIYDAGWGRYFPRGKKIVDNLTAKGYAKSDHIFVTNIDMWRIFDSLDYIDKNKVSYMPFSVDCEKYQPMDTTEIRQNFADENTLLLLQPSRQHWEEKGNDKVFKALKKITKSHDKVTLLAAEWGKDIEKSKKMINDLGIQKNIIWFKPVSKSRLIQLFNCADVILDQFPEPSDANQIWGPWGTAALEAMSCGKPLLLYYDQDGIDRFVKEGPPALRSLSVEQIFENLKLLLESTALRQEIGSKSREWIIKMHSPKVVAEKHMQVIKKLI